MSDAEGGVQNLLDFDELDDLEAEQSNSENEELEQDSNDDEVDFDQIPTHVSDGSTQIFSPPPRHVHDNTEARYDHGVRGTGNIVPDIRTILTQLDEDDEGGPTEDSHKFLSNFEEEESGSDRENIDEAPHRPHTVKENNLLGKLDNLFGVPDDDEDEDDEDMVEDNEKSEEEDDDETSFDPVTAAVATKAILTKSNLAESEDKDHDTPAYNIQEQAQAPEMENRMLQMGGKSMRQRRAERSREAEQGARMKIHAHAGTALFGDIGVQYGGPRLERLPGMAKPVPLTWASPWVDPSERDELQRPPRVDPNEALRRPPQQAPSAQWEKPPVEHHPGYGERSHKATNMTGMFTDMVEGNQHDDVDYTFANIPGMGMPTSHYEPEPPAMAAVEKVEEAPKLKLDSPVRCANCCMKVLEAVCCSNCLQTYYCSSGCQQEDWKSHKRHCKLQAELGMNERLVALGMDELRGL